MSELHVVFGTGPLDRYTAVSLLEMGHTVRLLNRSGTMVDNAEKAFGLQSTPLNQALRETLAWCQS